MTAAGLRREIGRLARLCEMHCEFADSARRELKPGAALAHTMCAGDCAEQARGLALELRARLASRRVRA